MKPREAHAISAFLDDLLGGDGELTVDDVERYLARQRLRLVSIDEPPALRPTQSKPTPAVNLLIDALQAKLPDPDGPVRMVRQGRGPAFPAIAIDDLDDFAREALTE